MNSSQYLLDTSRDYALYVCNNRAIPHVADGLKHGQRMALWLLRNRAEKIKTIALTGMLAFERLYVHGDQSCSNAIGLLAAPFKNNIPLIEGLGEFGSRVSPDAIGAPRYTEIRRSKAAQAFLYNDLDIVPLEENYDGSNQQPKHFLPLIPTVLLNGVAGIAVGWSTEILPRSLKSLIEATKQAVRQQPIQPVPPCFTSYHVTVTATGPTQWEFAGHATIVDTSTIRITELPPGLPVESFRRRLIDLEEAEQIQGFTDRSTETINITVKMKRGSVTKWTETMALDFFKLRERVTERIVVIDWDGKAIRTYLSAEAVIADFVTWRLTWYTTRFQYNIRRDQYELSFWLALKALFASDFPARLGGFPDRASLQQAIIATVPHELDTAQSDRIANLPTYKWTQAFASEVTQTINTLQTAIAAQQAVLASPDRLRAVYLDELEHLKA